MTERPELEMWRRMPQPISKWRRRARAAMRAAIDELEELQLADPTLLWIAVNAAYPFGERKREPYKCWLAEKRILMAAIAPRPTPALPSREEAEVCSVARDELELHPERADLVRRFLDEHAPNRLGRECPACGAKPGKPCREFEYDDPPIPGYGQYATGEMPLIVPHEARLVGHRDAGPLFEARS